MASTARKPPKPVFKSTSPYTEAQWPALTTIQRTDLMDLLTNLLQPIGDHRRTHIQPSKGKKRKRDLNKDKKGTKDAATDPPPPPPEISNHVLVGLNTVTRHLEALAAQNAPPTAPAHVPAKDTSDKTDEANPSNHDKASNASPQKLAMVLIPHNHPSASLPHAHIPTLVHLSTLSSPKATATRLLAVPPGCEPELAEALHIPHVGALAILDGAPGADALIAYVREQLDVTRCAWIEEALKPEWKGVRIAGGRG